MAAVVAQLLSTCLTTERSWVRIQMVAGLFSLSIHSAMCYHAGTLRWWNRTDFPYKIWMLSCAACGEISLKNWQKNGLPTVWLNVDEADIAEAFCEIVHWGLNSLKALKNAHLK